MQVLGCDWSWTVQSKTWPNMTLASYYAEVQDHVYNITTMKELVAEANYRGVRILPFFETIGHSGAWLSDRPTGRPRSRVCGASSASLLPYRLLLPSAAAIGQAYPNLVWCNDKQGQGLPHPFKNETW